jgi:hypothetical protein
LRSEQPQLPCTFLAQPLADTPDLQHLIKELKTVTDLITFGAGLTPKDQWLTIHGQKQVKTVARHTDTDNAVAVWLGATKPGLRLLHNNEWFKVDELPAHTALVWRGKILSGRLQPTVHNVTYKRVERRYAFLGWDIN